MRILIYVEDAGKADLYDLLVEVFPHEVTQLHVVGELVSQVEKTSPEIIIIDTISPSEQNLQICAQLRQISSVPILMVTVLSTPDLVAGALNAGADDVLTKPISKTLLIARINGLFTRVHGKKSRCSQDSMHLSIH